MVELSPAWLNKFRASPVRCNHRGFTFYSSVTLLKSMVHPQSAWIGLLLHRITKQIHGDIYANWNIWNL